MLTSTTLPIALYLVVLLQQQDDHQSNDPRHFEISDHTTLPSTPVTQVGKRGIPHEAAFVLLTMHASSSHDQGRSTTFSTSNLFRLVVLPPAGWRDPRHPHGHTTTRSYQSTTPTKYCTKTAKSTRSLLARPFRCFNSSGTY